MSRLPENLLMLMTPFIRNARQVLVATRVGLMVGLASAAGWLGAAELNCLQPSTGMQYYVAASGFSYPSVNSPQDGSLAFLGEVKLFDSDTAPSGFLPADGRLLDIGDHSALFSLLWDNFGGDGRSNFALPDLRGRVPVGAGQAPGGSDYILGESGGLDQRTLSSEQLPAHQHPSFGGTGGTYGGTQPLDLRQPFVVLTPIICTVGLYPQQDSTASDSFLGEIKWFAGDFAPYGWQLADGAIQAIASNVELFSLIGPFYGGDGRSTFALPDLRGRTPIHRGQGAGLSHRPLYWRGGSESVVLGAHHLSSHEHPLPAGASTASVGSGIQVDVMMPSLALHYMSSPLPLSDEIRLFAPAAFSVPWPLLDGGGEQPDLRGRAAVGASESLAWNAKSGTEWSSLTFETPIEHDHVVPPFVEWVAASHPDETDLAVIGPEVTAADGLSLAMHFALGSDPQVAGQAVLPFVTRDDTHMTFVFRRSRAATVAEAANQLNTSVEYGSQLDTLQTATAGEEGVVIECQENGFGHDLDKVTVTIPHDGAEQFFARLRVFAK
ncbi:phage tail protein [Haloferula sp.]|uniref:phage tail protein n=1 Tax=Haloferula sp. TaxID=2497595 RepID=UPI00329FEB03